MTNSGAKRKGTSTADCQSKDTCHFNKVKRPLYYHGMLIDEKRFHDEQEYHSQKRRLINRMVHGSGVVCGFELEIKDDKTLSIGCGLALDCCGREIYAPCDFTIALPQPSVDPNNPCPPPVAPSKEICYRIRVAYTEEDTDYQQVQLPVGNCGDKTCKPSSKREGFCIDLHVCECLPPRTSFDCKEFPISLDYVSCSCGCWCSCGADHWVSIGTVRVADGKITAAGLTYECRDYVISGQMLKQIFTKPDADTGECACPDQFERLKEVLGLICKVRTSGNDLATKVVDHLTEMDKAYVKLARAVYQSDQAEQLTSKRVDVLEYAKTPEKIDDLTTRVIELEAIVKRAEVADKKAKKSNVSRKTG